MKNKSTNRTIVDVLSYIKDNPRMFFLMSLFDLCFYVFLFLFNVIISSIFTKSLLGLFSSFFLSIMLLFVMLCMVIFIIFAYSVFKLYVLKILYGRKLDFHGIVKFFLLNLVIFAITLLIYLIWALFLMTSVSDEGTIIYSIITALPLFFFFYPFYNVAQFSMLKSAKIFSSLASGIRFAFKNIWSYIFLYVLDLLFIVLMVLIYFGIGYLFKSFVMDSPQLFQLIIQIFFSILLLFLVNLNRIYLSKTSEVKA